LNINNLNHFKIFLEECDIFKFLEMKILPSFNPINLSSDKHYTYKSIIMQNLKSTDSPKKSTENILSVDFKSTAKLHKTSKTRCQLTSLLKKPKKINLDQL